MQKRIRWSFVTVLIAVLILFFVFDTGFLIAKPTVATAAAAVQENSVTINGLFEDGVKISQYGFKWGENQSLREKQNLGSTVKANTPYKVTLHGLKAGCTYYYQAYAQNSKGCGYGEVKSFTVPEKKNEAPVVAITNPQEQAAFKVGEAVKINAVGQDDQKVTSMALYINDVLQTKVSSDSLTYEWNTDEVQPGDYKLRLSVWDGSKAAEKTIIATLAAETKAALVSTQQPAVNNSSSNNYSNYNSSNNSGSEVSRGGTTDTSKYPKLSKVNGIFGQFHYRELSGGRIEVDPNWVAQNIITITLPGLNRKVQVHKLAAEHFITAFTYIKNGTATINGRQVSLLSLINTMDGTYVTRHVNWDPSRGLSNHSWGTAIDINADDHFNYVDSENDPNMILWEKAFQPAGFSWGNRYSDSMHYELIE